MLPEAQFQPEDGGGPLPVEVLNKAKAELEPAPSAVADLGFATARRREPDRALE